MKKIIAVANQKGGVGKTVTTVNLGVGLARAGKRVLLIDCDPQGSLTASMGYQPDELEITLSTVMSKIIMEQPIAEGEGILHHAEGVDLMPSNIELSALDITLVNTMSRETILKQYIQNIENNYDVIIIDCLPSLGMLSINALTVADEVLIPIMAHFLSLKGLQDLFKTISRVRRQLNKNLSIAGILITMADMRTTYSREIVELLANAYGDQVRIFNSIIPRSTRAAEMSAAGQSIYLYDPRGKVAAAYESLTEELM